VGQERRLSAVSTSKSVAAAIKAIAALLLLRPVTAKAAPLEHWADFAGEVDRLRMKTSRQKQQENSGGRSGEEREHCGSFGPLRPLGNRESLPRRPLSLAS
jgi:hypothetical protein